MSDSTIILAQLEVEGCIAELYLNDVPVTRIAPPKLGIENVAVEQLLVPSMNKLELLVEPGSKPSVARTEQREIDYREMRAHARLIRFREGDDGTKEQGNVLAEVNFIWDTPNPSKMTFPHSLSTEHQMGAAHGRWRWQDAPRLTLDDALIDEANQLLDQVDAAIRTAHADDFWNLTELQTIDARKAYPAAQEGAMRARLDRLLAHYQTTKDPVFARDRNKHSFRLVAGGRMVELLDEDYTTAFKLRGPKTGKGVPYRIMLARIDGALRIVR